MSGTAQQYPGKPGHIRRATRATARAARSAGRALYEGLAIQGYLYSGLGVDQYWADKALAEHRPGHVTHVTADPASTDPIVYARAHSHRDELADQISQEITADRYASQ